MLKCTMRKYYFVRSFLLLGLAWSNITWRPWQTKVLGENVYPHLNLSLYFWKSVSLLNKVIIHYALRCLHNRSLRTCSVSTATKNKCSVTDVALTCDRLGWWELNKVLVSTCSGTKSWFLRTCRASLSLAGPKCGWITVFASTTGMDITKVKDERISYSRSSHYYQRYACSQNQNEQANCSMNKYKLVSTKQKNKNKYDMRPFKNDNTKIFQVVFFSQEEK